MTRPLMGRVREALFNILGSKAEEALVWDLFAGTGANGIEAMSRGARGVIFVERSRKPLGVLQRNLSILEQDPDLSPEAYTVLRGDAWAPPLPFSEGYLSGPPDLVFLDPPYPQVKKDPVAALQRLKAITGQMESGSSLVFHFPKGIFGPESFEKMGRVDLRSWGDAGVCLLSPHS